MLDEFDEDGGIDPEKIIRMDVDAWYDFMLRYERDSYPHKIILNHYDGGVWIIQDGSDRPNRFLWVYEGYIPMFDGGRYIGYGGPQPNITALPAHAKRSKIMVQINPAESILRGKTIPKNYIAYINVTGFPKKWKVKLRD